MFSKIKKRSAVQDNMNNMMRRAMASCYPPTKVGTKTSDIEFVNSGGGSLDSEPSQYPPNKNVDSVECKSPDDGSTPKSPDPYSVTVLKECAELQKRKARDYQNKMSDIRQASYYPSGCLTIAEIMNMKLLRIRSVIGAIQSDPTYKPNFESLDDSARDLINYAAFFVSYINGRMEGQTPDRDFLNRPKAQPSVVDNSIVGLPVRPNQQTCNRKL